MINSFKGKSPSFDGNKREHIHANLIVGMNLRANLVRLFVAASSGLNEEVCRLIDLGANIDYQDKKLKWVS
jgi:hypothetical protein